MNRYLAPVVLCLVVLAAGVRLSYAYDWSDRTEVSACLLRSKKALANKDYQLVRLLTSQILDGDVDQEAEIKALFMRGKAFAGLKEYIKAENVFSRIIEITPGGLNQAMALSLRVEVYEKDGKTDQALIDRDRIASML